MTKLYLKGKVHDPALTVWLFLHICASSSRFFLNNYSWTGKYYSQLLTVSLKRSNRTLLLPFPFHGCNVNLSNSANSLTCWRITLSRTWHCCGYHITVAVLLLRKSPITIHSKMMTRLHRTLTSLIDKITVSIKLNFKCNQVPKTFICEVSVKTHFTFELLNCANLLILSLKCH